MTTKITSEVIGFNTIISDNLADDSVGSGEIQDDAILENHYSNASIPTAAYKLLSVDTPQLADNAIEAVKISDNALIERHYSNQSIPAAAYKLLSVGTPQLADASVTLVKMGANSVGGAQLVNDSITRAKMADEAIGTIEIENFKVTPAKFEKGTKGDLFMAADNDGTFTRFATGSENSILSVKSGMPSWTNNVLPTGTMLDYCGLVAPAGWVMANGRTIGNVGSGAVESSADLEELFTLLWNSSNNNELEVSGGRGSSAAADWSAGKSIELPDARGRATFGRAAMGSSDSGRLNGVSAGGDTIAASGGLDRVILATAEIPEHYHFSFVRHTPTGEDGGSEVTANSTAHHYMLGGNKNYWIRPLAAKPLGANVSQTSIVGSGASHENMPPFVLTTKIIKK